MNNDTRHPSPDALDALRRELRRLRRSLRLWFVVHGSSRLAGLALILVLASLALDRVFRFDLAQRAVVLAVALVSLAAVAGWFIVRPLASRISDRHLCWHLRKVNFRAASRLLAALELEGTPSGAGTSAELAAQAVRDSDRLVDKTMFAHVLDAFRLHRARVILGCALLTLAVFPLAAPRVAGTWFRRNVLLQNVNWPHRTHLSIAGVTDDSIGLVQGDDLALEVRASGVRPNRVELEVASASEHKRETLRRSGESLYITTLYSVNRPMRIRCTGGDADTGWIDVKVTQRPVLETMGIAYTPPAYTRLGRQSPGVEWSVFRVVAGGTLSVSGRVSKVLRSAAGRLGENETTTPVLAAGRQFSLNARLLSPTNTTLAFELTDTDGLVVAPPPRVPLRILADRAPSVHAELENIGTMVTPAARIPLRMKVQDDFGVTDLSVVCNGKRAGVQGFGAWVGNAPRTFRQIIEIEPLGLQPGSTVSLHAEAVDNDDVSGPNKGASSVYLLQVEIPDAVRQHLMQRRETSVREIEAALQQQRDLEQRTRDWMDRCTRTTTPDAAQLKSLQSAQERLAASLDRLAASLSDVVAEARANQLDRDEPSLPARLGEGQVAPLREAAKGPATEAAKRLADARSRTNRPSEAAKSAAGAADEQAKVAQDVSRILQELNEGKGFDEALRRLRDLIHKQNTLRSKTSEADKIRDKSAEAK